MGRTGLTKEGVIEKAAELANTNGLVNVTVTTLSAALGIRKPSLYYHVKNQEEVFYELMIYGWRKVSEDLVAEIKEEEPEEALKEYARSIYQFAVENPGVFEAMLWYNKYEDERLFQATAGLYEFFFYQTDRLGINRGSSNHLMRTFRAFLEGFSLLVIHNAFRNPISIEDSFELSLNILFDGIRSLEEK